MIRQIFILLAALWRVKLFHGRQAQAAAVSIVGALACVFGLVDPATAMVPVFIGMAAPADYLDTVDLAAVAADGLVNEDVLQKIFDISDIPTPFLDMVGTDTCKNSYTEWVQDSLQSPDTDNAVISGADAGTTGQEKAGDARVGNHTQISDKLVQVTERSLNTSNIGRADELAYQVARRLQELRRDVEAIALTPQASVADNNNNTAGRAASLPAWVVTNDSLGTDGAATGFNTTNKLVAVPTAGDTRALTYANLKAQIEAAYLQNGNITTIIGVPQVVRRLNDFLFTSSAPIALPRSNVDGGGPGVDQTAQGWINVLKTDFGFNLKIVSNRLQPTYASTDSTPAVSSDLFLLDPSMVAIGYLDGYKVKPIAKLGLAERRHITVDWTVKVYQEKAHAVIRDLTPTATVTAT